MVVDKETQKTGTFQYLQEFVSYIVNRDFKHPRLADLCDIQPDCLLSLDHDIRASRSVYVNRVKVLSKTESGSPSKIGYILTPKNEGGRQYGWILVPFKATTSVLQIIRNSWAAASSMEPEDPVRHLVRHGIQFRTLVMPSPKVIPDEILTLNKALVEFSSIPPMINRNVSLNSADYETLTGCWNTLGLQQELEGLSHVGLNLVLHAKSRVDVVVIAA